MLFYKIDAVLVDDNKIKETQKGESFAEGMPYKAELFHQKNKRRLYLFIAFIKGMKVNIGAIAYNEEDVTRALPDFLELTELQCNNIRIEETTLKVITALLSSSCRREFIRDDFDVLLSFNINDLSERYRDNIHFTESIVNVIQEKSRMLKIASSLLCEESFSTEIERIFKGSKQHTHYGHPVHYMIQTDDPTVRDKMIHVLLSALYANGRIKSRRYCFVAFDDTSRSPNDQYERLYTASSGGVVVASYTSSFNIAVDEYGAVDLEVISRMCEVMKDHKNDVLTIFCLSRNDEKGKKAFMDELGMVTVVGITEDIVFGDRAKRYLRSLANEKGISGDRELYRCLMGADTGFHAADLNIQFDRWFDRKLKTTIYPQYADIACVKQQVATEKPKGNAYNELLELIGLEQAKAIIGQALDYYKAQKLFQSMGMTQERQAMHMVFTGNPGTAKTTVARLFAQIMKDNGLLSSGCLVECGRADLVGKYVGWTAQNVQKKFRAAKGGVLFIDEAYSLVDDKDGLYGDEAINTIVQEMENHREDLIVIFAGYPDKMETFIQKNPGLRSRIAYHLSFNDYSAEELFAITERMATQRDMRFGGGVREKLLDIFSKQVKVANFGNGRFVRNMFEKARMKQASRLIQKRMADITKDDIRTLTADDFEVIRQSNEQKERVIGFS